LLDRSGIWRRAGLGGSITGMDIAEARAALPVSLVNDFATRLLIAAERHFLNSYLCKAEKEE
jgi:hypothetical protein